MWLAKRNVRSARKFVVATCLPHLYHHFSSSSSSSSNTAITITTTAAAAAQNIMSERSASEILAMVQKRVQERDGWKADGVVSPMVQPSILQGIQMLKATALFQVPSVEELDQNFPVQPLNWDALTEPQGAAESKDIQITWLGHASLLVQMNGCNILTDPVFSNRCAPSQWIGPKRFRAPPCTIEELCSKLPIGLVLISHNHYDHLDYQTNIDICKYSPKTEYIVPLGLKTWFRTHVTTEHVIHEVDWHESVPFQDSRLTITAVPVRHWTNRLTDKDQTLWCGYRVEMPGATKPRRFFFPGDTAWFDDMPDMIGKEYGPFDVAAIPIGAYEPREFLKSFHINVEEAVRMKDAIAAQHAVPIHFGTFPLGVEPVFEPAQKLTELMESRPDADTFAPWRIGESKAF